MAKYVSEDGVKAIRDWTNEKLKSHSHYYLSNLATIKGSDTSTYPWRRIMSIPSTTASWQDRVGTYYLSSNYIGGPYYLFRVEFRTNNSSAGNIGGFKISIIATNSDPNNLAIASYSVATNGVTTNYSDIFVKVVTYPRMTLTRLSASDAGVITYYNSNEGSNASSRTEAYTAINGSGTGYASSELHSLSAYTYINYGTLTSSVNYANTAGSANSVAWGNVSGKPNTYTPTSHTHSVGDISDLYKKEYNLGYYDTITANADGSYTITRQTGYISGKDYLSKTIYKNGANNPYVRFEDIIVNYIDDIIGNCNRVNANWWGNTYSEVCISYDSTYNYLVIMLPNSATDTSSLNNISIQYKLATATTEKVEKNHYARYNQRFILDHNTSEAERSANLTYAIKFNDTSVQYQYCIELAPFDYKKGVTYTLSFDTQNKNTYVYFTYTALGVEYQKVLLDGTRKSFTFTPTKDALNHTLYVSKKDDDGKSTGICSNVMLNIGSVALPYQPYEGKVVHEKELGGYVTTDTQQTITGYKKISSIGIDTINGATLGNAIMRQNPSTGEVIVGSTVRPLRLWGNQTRPSYSKNDGVSYSDLALLSDVPSIYGVSQLYRHDIHFDITNGDGIKCTFWSTSNEKINNFSQIPYLAFSNIQVKNVSSEAILNVVQWQNDRFLYYDSTISANLVGNMYDGVTAYYINGEPQL